MSRATARASPLAARAGAGSFLLTALFATSACITPGQQRVELLSRHAHEFNGDVRWGRYEIAAQSLPPEDARRFLARVDLIENDLVIADFELTSITMGDPTVRATILVTFEWYAHSDPVIRKTVIEQKWEHQAGAWKVTAQRRVRGERFPLIPDEAQPAADAAAEPAQDADESERNGAAPAVTP